MEKEWYISLDGKQEGPYTILELKRHPFVTPDTLVWRQGFKEWVPIRNVLELEEVFKDEPESLPVQDLIKPKKPVSPHLNQEQDTLALQQDPFQFFIWLMIVIAIALYVFFQVYRNGR